MLRSADVKDADLTDREPSRASLLGARLKGVMLTDAQRAVAENLEVC
jgi:uncharacterized protein YjbI with pentapeptide repeats